MAHIEWSRNSKEPTEKPVQVTGSAQVLPEFRDQRVRFEGLGDEVVHAGGEAALAVFVEGVGGHGDDRDLMAAG